MDQVLISLTDGAWHDLKELSSKVHLTASKMKKILLFLSEFTFVELDAEGRRVRIDPTTQEWLQRLQGPQQEELFSTNFIKFYEDISNKIEALDHAIRYLKEHERKLDLLLSELEKLMTKK